MTNAVCGCRTEADPTWYEMRGESTWPEQAWRDPRVFADPAGDGYHSGKVVRLRDGRFALMGFVDVMDGQVVGEISDPQPVGL